MVAIERDGDTKGRKTGLAITLFTAVGVVMSGISLSFAQGNTVMAQATSPQTFPVPAGKVDGPAESKPGGTRPTTPAPEPARPDPDDAGHATPQPALPPAPAEKVAPPINEN